MEKISTVIFILMTTCIQCFSQTQSDTSDAVWSIVIPQPVSHDIDMKKVLVGNSKDSLITTFIQNVGSWKFSVDSIYFLGADATAFSQVSGFPKYELDAGTNKATEFHFVPNRVGLHQAEIVIITQADTLIQTIRGEGVQPALSIIADIIDFGVVNVGSNKDSLQAATIVNTSTSPLLIIKTEHSWPNDVDFSTLAGGGNFTLQPGDTCKMNLRFKPSDVGRTSGTLLFYYDGVGSPALVQLFGEGKFSGAASAELLAGSYSAYAGDTVSIPIILNNEENILLSGASYIKTDLSFNPTILWPIDLPYTRINDYEAKVTLGNLPISSNVNDPLIYIDFLVGLGNSDGCDLILSNAEAVDGNADISTISGHFTLLGICEDGGDRLINPNSNAGIISIKPNPLESEIEIEFNLSERGETEIALHNMIGVKALQLYSSDVSTVGNKSITQSIEGLSSGIYFLIFRTKTKRETYTVMIVR